MPESRSASSSSADVHLREYRILVRDHISAWVDGHVGEQCETRVTYFTPKHLAASSASIEVPLASLEVLVQCPELGSLPTSTQQLHVRDYGELQ
jgi:hypothetical protein